MITDLASNSSDHLVVQTDFVIVGAGVAGLILAMRLRRQHKRVAVLESGGLSQVTETHPLNRVVLRGDTYNGAAVGRYRCLGGTSTRWGGALIPFLPSDLSERPYLGVTGFPIDEAALLPYLSAVEREFGLDADSYDERFVEQIGAGEEIPTGDLDFIARFAKWPTFKKRNVASLYRDDIATDANLDIFINSTVTSFCVDSENGRVKSLSGRSESGTTITVNAKHYAICAGAIESTRLLLLLDRQYNGRVFQDCDALGRYFYDHISAMRAAINVKDVDRLNRLAGFRFLGSTMRSLRFELSQRAQIRERVGSGFVHISFRHDGNSGFEAVRRILRARQRNSSISPALLVSLIRDLPYLVRLATWRFFRNQLLWPTPALYELHVVVEQLPRFDNYIDLAPQIDGFGLPMAAINWRVSSQVLRTYEIFGKLFQQFWERRQLGSIGTLEWAEDGPDVIAPKADVYHPGGSTRMGPDRRSAVVDANLRVFGFSNLWTASSAVFPVGGGANPTMTLMQLAMRLGDHLAKIENLRA